MTHFLLDLWQLRVVEGETVRRGDDDVVQEVEPDSAISHLIAAASHLDVGGHREDLHEDIEQGHGGGVEEEEEEEEEEEDEEDDEGNSLVHLRTKLDYLLFSRCRGTNILHFTSLP